MKTKLLILAMMLFVPMFTMNAENADDIIKKSLEASGSAKVKEVKTMKAEMVINMMGMDIPSTMYTKKPEKLRVESSAMGQSVIIVSDGQKMWMSQNGQVMELPEDKKEAQLEQQKGNNPLSNIFVDYEENGYTATLVGTEKVKGKDAYKISLIGKDSTNTIMFVDKKTYLTTKIINKKNIMGNMTEVEVFINEYKKIEGMQIPMKMEMSVQGMTMDMKFNYIKINIDLDDKLFTKPQ